MGKKKKKYQTLNDSGDANNSPSQHSTSYSLERATGAWVSRYMGTGAAPEALTSTGNLRPPCRCVDVWMVTCMCMWVVMCMCMWVVIVIVDVWMWVVIVIVDVIV